MALSLLALAALSSASLPAHAQGSALAESLFQEGKELMQAGKIAEACAKFKASYDVDPSTGTLINLGTCREKEGRLASAWVVYNKALPQARSEGRNDRADYCQQRIQALRPLLSTVSVNVSEAARIPGLTVTLNDVSLAPAAYGVESPLDPGPYKVIARAPGYESFVAKGTLGAQADRKVVEVPALAPAPQATAAKSERPVHILPQPAEPKRPIGAPVYVAGGITLALGIGTAVTGVLYLGARSDFDDANADPSVRVADREDERSSASTLGTVSTVLGAATLVGAGVTAYLFVSRPAEERPVSLVPALGPGFQGVLVRGAL